MARHEDASFHARREAECRAMARRAAEPAIAAIHVKLAGLHEAAAVDAEQNPAQDINSAWWWPRHGGAFVWNRPAETMIAA